RLVEGVGPRAGRGVEGERAVGAGKARRGREMRFAAVDVGDVELAHGRRIAGRAVARAAILNDRIVAAGDDADRGVVVGAGDVDDDVLGGGAVGRVDGQRVGDVLAIGERVGLRLVEGVGPRAGGRVERERAVGAGKARRGREMRFAAVDVGDVELAHGRRIAGRAVARVAILDALLVAAGDDADRGVVVGAGDV